VVATSHKQKIVTKFAAESELVAASDAGGMSLGLRNYLISRDHDVEPAVLGQDNEASESIIVNGPSSSKRTRHLNIRYFHLTDYVRANELLVKHVPTENMVADVLTKPLQGQQFVKLRDKLLGYDRSSW
jgi:hypothetical protein